MDDIYYNNAYYAKVGGISTTEMNFLEVDFLFRMGFNLNVKPNTFYAYCSYLQREMMMMMPPHLDMSESSLCTARSSNLHLCFDEDESSHQHQQQQQQLAV
ncbi:Cyclin-U4-1 [Forsythia ovata]|uniref:Cyclin-U4-1 n=1 Tax=Forsythia ovata TaxID=205694 RepID=A0ABD1TNA7_9LAMI